jgi:hypothetical protein
MSKFKVATLTASQIAALPKQAQEDIETLKKDTRNFATNYSILKDADEAFYSRAIELLAAKGSTTPKATPKPTPKAAAPTVAAKKKAKRVPKRSASSTGRTRAKIEDKSYFDKWEKLGRSGSTKAKPTATKLKPITSSKSTAIHAKARALLLAKYPGAKKVVPPGSCIGVWQTSSGKKIDYAHFQSLAMGGKG